MADTNIDPDATTRGQQKKLDEIAEESAPPAKKPRMAKGVTMAATAKVQFDQVINIFYRVNPFALRSLGSVGCSEYNRAVTNIVRTCSPTPLKLLNQ